MSVDRASLKPFAERYIWWMPADEVVEMPERVVAQVMNIGDFDDTQALLRLVGEDCFRDVLRHAEIGQFNARSWHYWHYCLGLAAHGHVPPMPTRRFGYAHFRSTYKRRTGRLCDDTFFLSAYPCGVTYRSSCRSFLFFLPWGAAGRSGA